MILIDHQYYECPNHTANVPEPWNFQLLIVYLKLWMHIPMNTQVESI